MSKKVGIKTIAAKAGVSIGTVDRVLHNRGEVKKETKEKILRIIDELGYKPNLFAKSLASKTKIKIVVLIPDSSDNNPYWEKPLTGIENAKEALAGFNVKIIFKSFKIGSEKTFTDKLKEILKETPSGIVLNPIFMEPSIEFANTLRKKDIPFVFMDTNIKEVGKLAFYGQNAEQSGVVSASLMNNNLYENRNILIVKPTDRKMFSKHIEARINGFTKFFTDLPKSKQPTIEFVEIDLQQDGEPGKSLFNILKTCKDYGGMFVPNSRVFMIADYLSQNKIEDIITIGYDLVSQSVSHIKNGYISYLISQKPEKQALDSIMALFDHIVLKKKISKNTYSPIDIIIKENIDFYTTK